MQDISLHIMDIFENSARAQSKNIQLHVVLNKPLNLLGFTIHDDGTGMSEETLNMAQQPFYTSKSERQKKVGLGIPLFKQNAELCNGNFVMKSVLGKGTDLYAVFQYDHIDRMPIGKLSDTIIGAIMGHSEIDFQIHFECINNSGIQDEFIVDTRELKEELGDVPITYPDVVLYLNDLINEGIKKTNLEEI